MIYMVKLREVISAEIIFYFFKMQHSLLYTVPPSVVVHEPAPHAGARTDCEYIE